MAGASSPNCRTQIDRLPYEPILGCFRHDRAQQEESHTSRRTDQSYDLSSGHVFLDCLCIVECIHLEGLYVVCRHPKPSLLASRASRWSSLRRAPKQGLNNLRPNSLPWSRRCEAYLSLTTLTVANLKWDCYFAQRRTRGESADPPCRKSVSLLGRAGPEDTIIFSICNSTQRGKVIHRVRELNDYLTTVADGTVERTRQGEKHECHTSLVSISLNDLGLIPPNRISGCLLHIRNFQGSYIPRQASSSTSL